MDTLMDIDLNDSKEPFGKIEKVNAIVSGHALGARMSASLSHYFDNIRIYYRSNKSTYGVTPKWATRIFTPVAGEALRILQENYDGFKYSQTIVQQYWCHFNFAKIKGEWNLELGRPVVPECEMILSACNPWYN